MDLRDVMKNHGIDEPPKKEPFKKVKRPPPWLAPNDNEEKPEKELNSIQTGLNQNQTGLISAEPYEFVNDPSDLENQTGLNQNQTGLNSENNPERIAETAVNSENENQTGLNSKSNRFKPQNQTGLNSKSNRFKTENPVAHDQNKSDPRLRQLCKIKGNERAVIQYLITRVASPKSRETGRVRNRDIEDGCGIPYNSVKTAVKQALASQAVEKVEVARGQQGWMRFRIAEDAYQIFATAENQTGLNSKSNRFKPQNQTGLNSLSSSSIKKEEFLGEENPSNPPTTTTANLTWIDRIQIPPAASEYITREHVAQLARLGYTDAEFDLLQRSLDNFAACLETDGPGQWKKTPTNVFMGVARKGQYFDPPAGSRFSTLEARKRLAKDEERIERAVEQEIQRIALERLAALEDEGKPKPSLDDFPPGIDRPRGI